MKTATKKYPSKLSGISIDENYSTKALHMEMQALRQQGDDVTLKQFLGGVYGEEMSPEAFYQGLDIDLKQMTVEKLLNTGDLTRWLFPEIFRDAIRLGLVYTPFYSKLVTSEERIDGTGVTMPHIVYPSNDVVAMRVTGEGATITEGELQWGEKQVTIRKKARGLRQTYESIMFTPINLATIYFEDVGTRLGADLDAELIDVAINGDMSDGSEAAPVIGAAVADTLAYTDIARAWVRFKRINRSSSAMLTNEADAITILNMTQFLRNQFPGATPQGNGFAPAGTTLNVNTPLPSDQDVFVHSAVPAKKIVFVDTSRAFVQLTAMPLLVESEKLVQRQVQGQYASIITGFAVIFKDARLVLDYHTNLVTNPGPVAYA